MLITDEFLKTVDPRSPLARQAMVQAGDKSRIRALKQALISIGCCEIKPADVHRLGLIVYRKKYCFMPTAINIVLLSDEQFKDFLQIQTPVDLEVAYIRNGLIGLNGGRYA